MIIRIGDVVQVRLDIAGEILWEDDSIVTNEADRRAALNFVQTGNGRYRITRNGVVV